MQNWVGIVIALAMVLQVSILIALFLQTRRTMQKVEKTVTDLNDRAGPILTRVQIMLDDTQPKISTTSLEVRLPPNSNRRKGNLRSHLRKLFCSCLSLRTPTRVPVTP